MTLTTTTTTITPPALDSDELAGVLTAIAADARRRPAPRRSPR